VSQKLKELFPIPAVGELASEGVAAAKGFFSKLFGGGN